jgi:hypothetical protein
LTELARIVGGPGDGLSVPFDSELGYFAGTWQGYLYSYLRSADDPSVLILHGCEVDPSTVGELLAGELSAYLAEQGKHLEAA